MSFTNKFNNLTASQKRTVMAGGAIVTVLGISWALASVSESKNNRHPRANKPEVTVVSPTRTTGVEAFYAELQMLRKEQAEMKTKFERSAREREKPTLKDEPPKDGPNLADAIPELTAQTAVFDAPVSKGADLPPPPPVAPLAPVPPVPVIEAQPTPAVQAAPAPTGIRVLAEDGEVSDDKKEAKLNNHAAAAATKANKAPDSAFVPAGSMFAGVLLSGLDAPTSAVSQKNPTPVVVRVKREAVLPNYASIDVRECFVMAAGYGQLSTERALMRAETLSCVRSDGQVIETNLDAYIVGTDGKVGIPGRLVSKQGQMIAQTLIAGTLGGIGQALNRSRVPSLNLDPMAGQSLYEQESMSSIAQSGVSGGVGSATNMIAKFYLDMAKETFPVVEVPAGEVVTVIVTRGSSLPMKGSTNLQRVANPQEGQNARTQQPRPQSKLAAAAEVVAPAEAAIKAATTAAGAHGAKPTLQNGLGW